MANNIKQTRNRNSEDLNTSSPFATNLGQVT